MRWTRLMTLAVAIMLATAVPAAAQQVLVDDDLTQPGVFTEQGGGDIAVLTFDVGGMTVASVNKGSGLYFNPNITLPPTAENHLAIEVTAIPGTSKTGVGIYCLRSETYGGVLFSSKGKKWAIYDRDEDNQLVQVDSGSVSGVKRTDPVTLRAECALAGDAGMALTYFINGEEVTTYNLGDRPAGGRAGLYVEGLKRSRAVATFTDLRIEELAPLA